MNFKYIKNIAPVAAVVLTMGLSSCNYLDVEPIDPSTTMTPSEPELYTKCYANMALAGQGGANGDCDIDGLDGGTTGFVRQLWNANELTTDEAICAWGDTGIPGFNYNQWDASHPMLQGFYYRLFAGINYCNHYLDVCKDVDATRTAEVRFLRCLYYYYLLDCFGNPPFALELSAESPKQIKRADLYAWLEGEIKDCMNDLMEPAVRKGGEAGYGRADKDAAYLLLARLYLNAEVYTGTAHWTEAKEYAEKVITGPHKLWTSDKNGWTAYQMLFMGDNGENGAYQEAILPLLQDGKTTTSWGTTLFLMASCWKADMDTEGNYGTSEFWAGNRARQQLVEKFFSGKYEGTINDTYQYAGDDRALFYGVDRELHVSNPNEYTSGYAVGKFRNTYSTGAASHHSQYIDTDFFLMRSAEAYLIAAEADARLNSGVTTEAGTGYINALRTRAHANTEVRYNLQDILDECAREFYHEGHRRTDLVRHGVFGGANSGTYKWDWKGGVETGAGFEAYRNIFAIPAEDVNANPNLVQNPGY